MSTDKKTAKHGRSLAALLPLAAVAANLAACAPAPPGYTLYPVRPVFSPPYAVYHTPSVSDDGTDPVIPSPPITDREPAAPERETTPAPEPETAASAPQQTAPAPQPNRPPPDSQASAAPPSPTCGYWRLGCGILWP